MPGFEQKGAESDPSDLPVPSRKAQIVTFITLRLSHFWTGQIDSYRDSGPFLVQGSSRNRHLSPFYHFSSPLRRIASSQPLTLFSLSALSDLPGSEPGSESELKLTDGGNPRSESELKLTDGGNPRGAGRHVTRVENSNGCPIPALRTVTDVRYPRGVHREACYPRGVHREACYPR